MMVSVESALGIGFDVEAPCPALKVKKAAETVLLTQREFSISLCSMILTQGELWKMSKMAQVVSPCSQMGACCL